LRGCGPNHIDDHAYGEVHENIAQNENGGREEEDADCLIWGIFDAFIDIPCRILGIIFLRVRS